MCVRRNNCTQLHQASRGIALGTYQLNSAPFRALLHSVCKPYDTATLEKEAVPLNFDVQAYRQCNGDKSAPHLG